MTRVKIQGVVYELNNDGVSAEGYSQVVIALSEDIGPKGDPGPAGPVGPSGPTGGPFYFEGPDQPTGMMPGDYWLDTDEPQYSPAIGLTGATGPTGAAGVAGGSAYDIWLSQGNVGSVADFLSSLGAGYYRFVQNTPTNTWMITHPLGYFPNVTVVDSAGSVVEGDIAYVSTAQLTISFSAPFSGEAYLS